jgi:peptidoglycan/LPS O-acetylase OafA/YrhL
MPEKAMPLFPQLDGLRATAALLVVFHHFVPQAMHWDPTQGRIGPDLFFVLSGFLITRSLLHARSRESSLRALLNFYARRARRILPLHFLALAVVMGTGLVHFGTDAWWHWGFLSNILFVLRGEFVGAAGHLWTLAVEQHFYLMWPLAVLFLPVRWILPAAGMLIGGGLIFRLHGGLNGYSDIALAILTPAAFEALGIGAVVACWRRDLETSAAEAPATKRWWLRLGFLSVTGLLLVGARVGAVGTTSGWLNLLLTALSRAALLGALVGAATVGIPSPIGRLLESTIAIRVARYSFGIYLSHNFLYATVKTYGLWFPGIPLTYAQPLIAFVATLAVAALGYHTVEARLLQRPGARPTAALNAVKPLSNESLKIRKARKSRTSQRLPKASRAPLLRAASSAPIRPGP